MTIVGLLPILSVAAIFLARMAELKTKRNTIAGFVQENLTFRLFMLAGVLMVGGGSWEYLQVNHGRPSWIAFAAGWACGLFSFVLRRQAIAALGRFWSLHIEIRESHQLVQEGPFRWMRHPTYF